MGALHQGHAALMARARQEVGPEAPLVASVFVNPLQFAPGEDLDRYPRTLDADLEVCTEQGVDVVFAPSVDEVYPGGAPQVAIDPGPMAAVLEGKSRPTHFAGVLTVVAKLFGLVRPDVAVFGEKDYQQLGADPPDGHRPVPGRRRGRRRDRARVRRAGPLQPQPVPRPRAAPPGPRPLPGAVPGPRRGSPGAEAALAGAWAEMRDADGVDLDYLELTAPDLGPAPDSGPARLLVAARVGPTRLIDNVALELA